MNWIILNRVDIAWLLSGLGWFWLGSLGYGLVKLGFVFFCYILVLSDVDWFRLVWVGLDGFRLVWNYLVWLG